MIPVLLTASVLAPGVTHAQQQHSAPWPASGAALHIPEITPASTCARRVFIDAGHGAPGNPGCTSAFGESEQTFNLLVAEQLAADLRSAGFQTRLSRSTSRQPSYRDRLRAARRWRADVLLSIHADVRGQGTPWSPASGTSAHHNDGEPGFALLWSDRGKPQLALERRDLARRLARRLSAAGLLAYDGRDYAGLYGGDQVPGVFVDRHRPGERVYMLFAPSMPSVVIETHHAWDRRETARWHEPRTWRAFSAAVAAGLCD